MEGKGPTSSNRANTAYGVLARIGKDVVLLASGLSAGFLLGLIAAERTSAGNLVQLYGAFLGAVVTVVGASWLTNRRARADQKKLKAILARGVDRLRYDTATRNIGFTSEDEARRAAQVVYGRWQHFSVFSPYRDLEDFDEISAMAELDASCRRLAPFQERREATITSTVGGSAVLTQLHQARRRTSNVAEISAIFDAVARDCDAALRVLDR